MSSRIIVPVAVLLFNCLLSAGQTEERRDTLRHATITAERSSELLSSVVIDLPAASRIVSPVGEGDVIKFIQTIPGVSSGTEGSSSYFVRGGNNGNNLIELDGVRVYGASHLLGFSTSIPQGILSDAKFHVGGINGEHSNLLSSVLELRTVEKVQRFDASMSISNFFAGAKVAVPIVKDKLSLVVSARFSPFGKEYNLLNSKLFDFGNLLPDSIDATIYDVFAKLCWTPGAKTMVSLSYFKTDDGYKLIYTPSKWDRLGWSNEIVNLQVQTVIADEWNYSGTLSMNRFSNHFSQFRFVDYDSANLYEMQSSLNEIALCGKVVFTGESLLDHSFGYKLSKTGFILFEKPESTLLGNIWYQAGYNASDRCFIKGMMRGNLFLSDKAAGGGCFFNPEISLSSVYHLSPSFGLSLTGDYLTQFFHLVDGLPTGWSMDLMVPATLSHRPETALQIAAGGFFKNGRHNLNISAYLKWYNNLVFNADATAPFRNNAAVWWQSQLYSGRGRSRGIETSYSYDGERLDLSLAYTFSHSDRVYADLCKGKPFPAKFDRPHILNLNLDWSLGKVEDTDYGITAFFTVQSGHLETAKTGYLFITIPELYSFRNLIPYWGSYNNYRMPAYIRLDIGYYGRWETRHTEQYLSFGVYNVFNRHNPSYIFAGLYADQQWEKLSLFPIMPSLSYKVTWR